MPYEAKTDWKYDDLVTEKDMNRIEQGLKDAHVPAHQPLTLNPGLQVVEVENDTPFRMGEVKGRTLVNLLGRAGACDDLNAWFQHKEAGSPVFSIENSTIKIVTDIERTSARIARFFPEGSLKTGKFYVAIANIKCTEVGECGLYVADSLVDRNKTTDWETLYSTLSVSSEMDGYFVVGGTVKANVTTHIDEVRLYEISESEYNAIESMTPEQVAAKYPYVDGVTNVNNPYAIVTGGNLLPPFTEWVAGGGGFKAQINQTYDFLLSTSSASHQAYYVDITPIPNKTYTLSSDKGRMYCNVESSDGTLVRYIADGDGGKVSFTTSSNIINIRVQCLNLVGFTDINDPSTFVYGAGDFRFTNPMLVPGTEPKPFVPQQRSMLAFEAELAAHPVNGSNPDTLFMGDDGLPYVLEPWKKVTLDGSLDWRYDTAPKTDFKTVKVVNFAPDRDTSKIPFGTKYTGQLLGVGGASLGADIISGSFWSSTSGNHALIISIANTDSGWGPGYNPTQDEIKAYFLGWKMGVVGQPRTVLYNGEGGRVWYKISMCTVNAKYSLSRQDWVEYDVPTYPAGVDSVGTYNYPYRLQYLKAKPTVEPVRNYEMGATLSAGSNMVEVGSGIVIREKANPVQSGDLAWFINAGTHLPSSRLKNKVNRWIQTYRNQAADGGFTTGPEENYGVQAGCDNYNFDPTAIYHVTYTILDPTLAAPINGNVAANLRGTVSDFVRVVRTLESGKYCDQVLTAADILTADNGNIELNAQTGKEIVLKSDNRTIVNGTFAVYGHVYGSGFTVGHPEQNHTYINFNANGERKGYIGPSDANNPNTINIVAEKGPINMYGSRFHLNGRNVLQELDSVKQSVVDGKGQVAAAINDKGGGPVSANSTFPELATEIINIPSGGYLEKISYQRTEISSNETGTRDIPWITMPVRTSLFMFSNVDGTLIQASGTFEESHIAINLRDGVGREFNIMSLWGKNVWIASSISLITVDFKTSRVYVRYNEDGELRIIDKPVTDVDPNSGPLLLFTRMHKPTKYNGSLNTAMDGMIMVA